MSTGSFDEACNSTSEKYYEKIGKDVLSSFESGQIPEISRLSSTTVTRSLLNFLSTPVESLEKGWEDDFEVIINSLSQIDFAIYGKKISRFLINASKAKSHSRNHTKKYQNNSPRHHHSQKIDKTKFEQPEEFKEIKLSRRKFPEWLPTIE